MMTYDKATIGFADRRLLSFNGTLKHQTQLTPASTIASFDLKWSEAKTENSISFRRTHLEIA